MQRITVDKLRLLYKLKTSEEAAKLLGVTVPTYYRYLRIAGVKLRGRGSRPKTLVLGEKKEVIDGQ